MEINSLDAQKQLIMQNEFAQLNIVHNQPISLQEIQFALDQKLLFNEQSVIFKTQKNTNEYNYTLFNEFIQLGQTFDRIILQQLFEQMNLRYDNQTTIDKFIKVYLNAEKVLLQKIDQSKEYLQNYLNQARETKNKIQIVKSKEKINDHGITEDSTFSFSIYSAVIGNQYESEDISTYVQIVCGSEERKTEVERSHYPQFNYQNSLQYSLNLNTCMILKQK